MIRRTGSRLTAISLIAALGVTGCGSSTPSNPVVTDAGNPTDNGTQPDGGNTQTDGGNTQTDGGMPGACVDNTGGAAAQTFDYVINTLSIDNNTMFNQPHTGFNVDNAFSPHPASTHAPDCSHQDYFSAVDPDQNQGTCMAGMPNGGPQCHGGVDNQLPDLASTVSTTGTDIGASLNTQLAQGKLSLLVRVSNVNGTPGPTLNDCAVNIKIYIGHPAGSDCSTIYNGHGNFAVDNASLTTAGDLNSARYSFTGQIINGRLRIAAGTMGMDNVFTLPLPPIMGVVIMLNVHQLQLRLSMTNTAGTNGNLGGYLLRTETAAAIRMAAPQYASLVDMVIGGLVDVATGTPLNCGDTDTTQGGIGFGFGFTTTGATIAATTVTGAQPGTCGAPVATDGGTPSDGGTNGDAGH